MHCVSHAMIEVVPHSKAKRMDSE